MSVFSSLSVAHVSLALVLALASCTSTCTAAKSIKVLQAHAYDKDPNVAAAAQHRFTEQAVSATFNFVSVPSTSFVEGLVGTPGTQSTGYGTQTANNDGWYYYGWQADEIACNSMCYSDANCWAYTWFSSSAASDWQFKCYGRQPWTSTFVPHAVASVAGAFSAYKKMTSWDTSINFIANGYSWSPSINYIQVLGDFYLGNFGSTTRDWNYNSGSTSGFLAVNGSRSSNGVTLSSPRYLLVAATVGAYSYGVTSSEDMCVAAFNFDMYLELNSGTPTTIFAMFYSWYDSTTPSSYNLANYCFVGSGTGEPVEAPYSASFAHSGKRVGYEPFYLLGTYHLS